MRKNSKAVTLILLLLTSWYSCYRGNCLVWCPGELYQTDECVSEPSTGGRCTSGPLQSLMSRWYPRENILITSKVFSYNSENGTKATRWCLFGGLYASYHNGLMLHIRHHNHNMIILPEAVLHTHHILSASAKKTKISIGMTELISMFNVIFFQQWCKS